MTDEHNNKIDNIDNYPTKGLFTSRFGVRWINEGM
jgi:hypothetical protein